VKASPRLIPRSFFVIVCLLIACALYAAAGVAERRASARAGAFNGRIAFTSSRNAPSGEIYLMNPDGSGQTNLTKSPASEVCPAFSPDGKRIAFLREWNSLWVMNADGSGQTPVLTNSGVEFAGLMCADWSPDGTKLAFTGIPKDDPNNQDIFVVGADGTNIQRLTADPASDSSPRWSPDGKKIAFASIRDRVPGEVNFEIYVMDADGSAQTRLTNNTKFDHSPAWSPDGARIAFTSRRDDNFEIYVMNADGSGQTRLTDNPNDDMDAEWSPDGTKIAFTTSRDNRFGEIYTMNPDGSAPVNLTNADFFDMDPSWQRLSEPVFGAQPTPTPTPTPTPPSGTPGSAEIWEPYTPTAAQTELTALSCGGRTFVKVKFTFNDGGYRVTEWGAAQPSGNSISADVKAEHWTGVTTLAITFAEKVYDLGALAPGSYTFTLSSRGAAVKSISFDAGTSAANPADDATVFVWQHYLDFLGRDPDAPGLSFWQRNMSITCGADAACAERKRVDTSAAFFLSIEFQRTGFLVHKLYRASYGRMPRRAEFLPDQRQMARGVVVNAQGWEALLEENTRAFFDEWVTRPQFRFEFDQLTDAQFVERLAQNADFGMFPETRNAYVVFLTDHRMTRAQVLRAIAEDADFSRKESAPAFVLMQYFGYLQRNPDEGRDANLDGYNYWLGKLNQFGGDHVRAEMVKAFIESAEYRARFCGQ
jgi:Tol biopolymer transport system component